MHDWQADGWRSWKCAKCGATWHGSHTSFTKDTDPVNLPPKPDSLIYEGPVVNGQGMTCDERWVWADLPESERDEWKSLPKQEKETLAVVYRVMMC